jgi:diphosphomevalonate decarboxylase
MKATAQAPANIAFIKYWGRRDPELRIPYNPSISMNLSNCMTTTTVEFSWDFEKDSVTEGFGTERILKHVDRLRDFAKTDMRVKVATSNNFPTSSGVASSASGFAALTVAATAALGLKFSEKELSKLARLGSGSACRSIPDGFVKWEGEFAYSLYSPDYWDLRDIIVIVGNSGKDVSSSAGHDTAETSPFFQKRLQYLPDRMIKIERALKEKNFMVFGETLEEDCWDCHHVMQTQTPPLIYWNDDTKRVIDTLKRSGLPAYFTIDAGPNVHIICERTNEKKVVELFKNWKTIINKPVRGAHLI